MGERIIKTLWIAAAIALFGPFALLFGTAVVGINLTEAPGFGTWFMLALTACGLITFISLIVTGVRSGRLDWLPLIVVGAATYWWLQIALRPFL